MLQRKHWLRLLLSGLLFGGSLGFLNVGHAIASDDGGSDPINLPLILSNGKSLNWSGYAVQAGPGAVSAVKAQWKVPAVSCAGLKGNAYSSAWIGIDGYAGATVEQTGTRSDCLNGVPTYRAFYEMFPAPPVIVPLNVKAGDSVSAAVSYAGANTFVLTLTNQSTRKSFSTTQVLVAALQSAEVVVERSTENKSSGVLLPLANFGTATFSSASVTINGKTAPLRNAAWQNQAITLANLSGQTLAVPSGLNKSGGFSVAWKQAQ